MEREPLPPTYRQREMETIARWLEMGDSGAVVGLAGSGKSNLLRFLWRRPDVLKDYFLNQSQPVIPVPLDFNVLPDNDLSTFYRVILRAFYEERLNFPENLHQPIINLYQESKRERDPFVPQSALREWFSLLKAEQIRVVLVMDRFDYFCQVAPPYLFNTLRALRDNAKRGLSYLVGLRQEIADFVEPSQLGELYELLDGNTLWVGPFDEGDAKNMIKEETTWRTSKQLGRNEIIAMLTLSGHYPALLKAVCRWWRTAGNTFNIKQWITSLRTDQGVQNRLQELWGDLTQEEQLVLLELEEERRNPSRRASRALEAEHRLLLERLTVKGLVYRQSGQWLINGNLLSDFVAQVKERSRGRIWLDQATGQFWQGSTKLELTQQQHNALLFFYHHLRERLPKTELLMEMWSDDWESVDEARLYQLIRQLRLKVEPNPSHPVYIVSWYGTPEGGYQFFPEGKARDVN